jgi:hypothetical protein
MHWPRSLRREREELRMSLAKIAKTAKEDGRSRVFLPGLSAYNIGLMAATIDGSTRSWKSGPLSRT